MSTKQVNSNKSKKINMKLVGFIFVYFIIISFIISSIVYYIYYYGKNKKKDDSVNYFIRNTNSKEEIEAASNSEPVITDNENDNIVPIPPNPYISPESVPPDFKSLYIGLGVGISMTIGVILVNRGISQLIAKMYIKQAGVIGSSSVQIIAEMLENISQKLVSRGVGPNVAKFIAARFTTQVTSSAAIVAGTTAAAGTAKFGFYATIASITASIGAFKTFLSTVTLASAASGAYAFVINNPITMVLIVFMAINLAVDLSDPAKLSSTASKFEMMTMRNNLLKQYEKRIIGPFDNMSLDEFNNALDEKMKQLLLLPNNKYIYDITQGVLDYVNSTDQLKVKYLEFRTLMTNLINKNETQVVEYLDSPANKENSDRIKNYINRILFGDDSLNPDPLQLPLDVLNNIMENMYVSLSYDAYSDLCISKNGFITDGHCSYNKDLCRTHYDWPKVKESLDIMSKMSEYVKEDGTVDENNIKYKELKNKYEELYNKYDINYSEWSNGEWKNGKWISGECQAGLGLMRNFCNEAGTLYNETEKMCVIDEKYCKMKGLKWEFNNTINFRVENDCLNSCRAPIKDRYDEIEKECSKLITNKDETSQEYLQQFKEYFNCKKSKLIQEQNDNPNDLFAKCIEDCKYDCILPGGQIVSEALFGMSLGRSIDNSSDITNYEKCKKGEIDTGRTCQYCEPGKVLKDGLCYTQCPAGYYQNGPLCWQQCPKVPFPRQGFPNNIKNIRTYDIGVSCNKHNYSIDAYKNITGLADRCISPTTGIIGFNTSGPIVGNLPGYTNLAGICWSNCPPGMRDDGAYCAKNTIGIGAGTVPLSREKKKLVGFGVDQQPSRICPQVPVELPDLELSGICWTSSASINNKCPDGIWNLDGVCWNTYDYLKGDKNNGCGENREYINGLCYPKCKEGYSRIEGQSPDGCYPDCPRGYSRGANEANLNDISKTLRSVLPDSINYCYKNCPNPTYEVHALDCIGGCSAINRITKEQIKYPDEEQNQSIIERLRKIDSICYGTCPDGYTTPTDIDLFCYDKCPNGSDGKPLRDDGLICAPHSYPLLGYIPESYGRGVGVVKERICNTPGYVFNAGVCWESKPCRDGYYYDIGFCRKVGNWFDYYPKIIGSNTNITDRCPSGKEDCGGLCYDSCPSDYDGVGCNLCRKKCNGHWDGGFCYNYCKEGYHRVGVNCIQNNNNGDVAIPKNNVGKSTSTIQSFRRDEVKAAFDTKGCIEIDGNGGDCGEL